MDSDDDYQSFSPPKEPSPPRHFRRLKRLKKSNSKTSNASLPELIDDPLLFSTVDFAKLEALENDSEPQKFSEVNSIEETSLSQESLSQGSENETESVSGVKAFKAMRVLEFDAEVTARVPESGKSIGEDSENFEPEKIDKETIGQDFGSGSGVEVSKAKRVLEFDAEVTGRVHENEKPIGEERESFELEKSHKEEIGQEGLLEEKEKKKKKKKKKKREKSHSGEELKTSNKRREEKERKAYLKELHAESQRLLRETSDASFKPIQVVQKPISSVLEKIRKRKLEIAKSIFVKDSPHGSEGNIEPTAKQMDLDVSNEERAEENATIIVDKEMVAPSLDRQSLAASDMDIDADKKGIHEYEQNQVLANEEPTPVFRAPVDDTQDLFDDSELNGATATQNDDEQLNSPLEEDFAPSLLTMNLKFDSAPVDDSSSEEEDNNKENVNPGTREIGDGSSSPRGDPVKDFIDDEAEEEDDSDNDLIRFQENEAADDIDDFEELNDMIATECEERPTDKERRNELHQKWLEEQDAAGTDNLMQRLKCSTALRDTFLADNEFETDGDDDDDEFDVKAGEDSLPQKPSRVNIKKAKQIILDLFTEKEDTYLSDDDDGTLRRHAQCFIRKEEQVTLVSPDDDASSREVFGLIKKMNIATDNKKKPKALSSFDSVLKGGNRDHSSKSSFLGRVSNHPLPSSHKQGSATVRSFIFGRDDSNSRSSMSMSEDSSDTVSQPARNVTAKYSKSQQSRGKTESSDSGAERFSLLKILKRSSSQSQACNQDSAVDLTKSMFGFRIPKKTSKIEGRS